MQSSQRRDSIGGLSDYNKPRPSMGHYYGGLGTPAGASPVGAGLGPGPLGLVHTGQSLTPPPSLVMGGRSSDITTSVTQVAL